MIYAGDKTTLYWVARSGSNDRDRFGCVFGRARHLLTTDGNDHLYLSTNEIVGELRQEFIVSASPVRLDCNILTLDESSFVEPALDGGEPGCKPLRRAVGQKSDYRHRGLLRARDEWPRRRAA